VLEFNISNGLLRAKEGQQSSMFFVEAFIPSYTLLSIKNWFEN
jgi:hypothetical protein